MSAWWLLCSGSVGAMLGFGLAAMIAAGKRADLEAEVADLRALCERATAAGEAWRARHEAITYAFSTLCECVKRVGLSAEAKP